MAFPSYVKPLVMLSLDSATLAGSYLPITGAGGLLNSLFLLKIVNNSTVDVIISYDGTNPHDYIPTKTAVLFDLQSNASPNNLRAWLAQGTHVYVNGATGVGDIFLTGWYQPSVV